MQLQQLSHQNARSYAPPLLFIARFRCMLGKGRVQAVCQCTTITVFDNRVVNRCMLIDITNR